MNLSSSKEEKKISREKTKEGKKGGREEAELIRD